MVFVCVGRYINIHVWRCRWLQCLTQTLLLRILRRIYAISAKLSPTEGSSGVQTLEAESFSLHCRQTLTGWHDVNCVLPTVTYHT